MFVHLYIFTFVHMYTCSLQHGHTVKRGNEIEIESETNQQVNVRVECIPFFFQLFIIYSVRVKYFLPSQVLGSAVYTNSCQSGKHCLSTTSSRLASLPECHTRLGLGG